MGRPQLAMNKLWQMMQSKDTKNLNQDKDFEEVTSKVKQVGWNESTRTKRFWRQDEDAYHQSLEPCANRQDGRRNDLVAECFSFEEKKAAQGVLHVDVRLGQRTAIQGTLVRLGRPGVERSVR